MEIIQNIKYVLKNVKLIKDKNISRQYEKVQKVDDFTNNIKDLINKSLDLIEQRVVPKLTFFNNVQQQPKAIQSSSDLHGSSGYPSNKSETILNEPPASISVAEEEPPDEEEEEGIESSPIDFEGDDIESTPNRLAVVIDDHLDIKILKKHCLPSFDFLPRRYDSLFKNSRSKVKDFKEFCDDLKTKIEVVSGKLGEVAKSNKLSDESKKEKKIRLRYELEQIKKY